MSKIGIFFLIVANLLPFSSASKTKLDDYLKSKFATNEGKQAQTVAQIPDYRFSITPEPKDTLDDPTRAEAQLALDLESGKVIESKNADTKLQIASLTKLMTAYTVLKDLPLNRIVTVKNINLHEGDSVMGINNGEQIDVESLLKGLLIPSGSDAAQALANEGAGSISTFVTRMNQNAADLGLKDTHFTNPVGWDDAGNYSTAKDIATLTRILLNNQTFRKIVSTNYAIVHTTGGRQIELTSTDYLLSDPNFLGVKTGTTGGAGECLVSLNNQTGREILTVVLNSSDRFGETKAFFDWINSNFVLK